MQVLHVSHKHINYRQYSNQAHNCNKGIKKYAFPSVSHTGTFTCNISNNIIYRNNYDNDVAVVVVLGDDADADDHVNAAIVITAAFDDTTPNADDDKGVDG